MEHSSEEEFQSTIVISSFAYHALISICLLWDTFRFFVLSHKFVCIVETTWTLAIFVLHVWHPLLFTWFVVRSRSNRARNEHCWGGIVVHNYFFPNSTMAVWICLCFDLFQSDLYASLKRSLAGFTIINELGNRLTMKLLSQTIKVRQPVENNPVSVGSISSPGTFFQVSLGIVRLPKKLGVNCC